MADDISGIMGYESPLGNNSLFKDSPFGEYWEKNLPAWAVNIFGNAKILDTKNIIVADLSNKISYSWVDFYNLLLAPTPKYSFKVFAHPDGIKVLEMYNNPKIVPSKDYEVLVFIETDDGKFDFGRIVRVKFGPKVSDDLKNKYFRESPLNETDPDDIAEKFIKGAWAINNDTNYNNAKKDVGEDSSNIKDLLTDAIEFEYNNHKFDDFSWFALFINGADYFIHQAEDLLFDLAAWLRTKELKEEKYWNGDLPDGKYSPPILPDSIFIQDERKRYDLLKSYFNKNYTEISDILLQKLQSKNPIIKYIKNLCDDWIAQIQDFTDTLLLEVSKIYIPEGVFVTAIKHWIAFLVGLWNGIIELLACLIELVGILLMVFTNEIGYRLMDPLLESLENFMNDLIYNTKQLLEAAFRGLVNAFFDFADWYNHYEGKSYQILKEIGELVPEILLWIIPELQAAKLSRVEALAAAVERKAAAESLSTLPEAERAVMARALKEKLENGELEKFSKEAVRETEEKIAEKTAVPVTLEEVVVNGTRRKRVRLQNPEDLGKNGNVVKLALIDDTGTVVGQLTRSQGDKGRRLIYNLEKQAAKINLESEINLMNSNMAKEFNFPIGHGENILYADLNIPKNITDELSGLGELMLDDALVFYQKNSKFGKVDGSIGLWIEDAGMYSDYGGQSVNLTQFWDAVGKGMTYERAAFETFTGKWAKKNGFNKISYTSETEINLKRVRIRFLKEK